MKPKFHGQSVFLWPLLPLWSKYEQKLTRRVQPKISSEDQSSDIFVDIFCTNSGDGVVFIFLTKISFFGCQPPFASLIFNFMAFHGLVGVFFVNEKCKHHLIRLQGDDF